MKKGIIKTDDY